MLTRLTSALGERYRVSREIGVGGMARVYLAHDLRHERDVAIKVLHPELAAALGADRFLAEIKTTAKLQHPHILPLLDSGEADGLLYYVMPFVAGESLRTRIERETQLPVDDAVRIAREVASALESAHRQGVIHRDIKPENILMHEDQALVADFGIALAVSAAGGPRMTQTGLSLGTPAYMAPEQAMGERVVDGRADIYALGAVLYEMLVGEAPFTGPSVQAIVARVMTEQPRAVTGQRRSVPAHVNAAVLKALEKLPADRFHTAAEMSRALGAASAEAARGDATTVAASTARKSGIGLMDVIPWSITALALVAAGVFAIRVASRQPPQTLHVAVELPPGMTRTSSDDAIIAIDGPGTRVAVAVDNGDGNHLLIRDLATDEQRIVPGSNGISGSAAFSPDGKWIAFSNSDHILKSALSGGPAVPLIETRWGQMAWVGNDALVFTKSYDTGLFRISAAGADSTTLTTPDRTKGELGHWWPQTLPDGEHVLFTNFRTPADRSTLEILSLSSGERRVVLEGGYHGRIVDGRLLFARSQAVMVVPFDLGALKTTGTPVPTGLDIQTNTTNGWAGFAVATNGTIAYLTGSDASVALTWVDESGNEEAAIPEAGVYRDAIPSPVGNRIAVLRDGDVYVYDMNRKFFSRLTRTEQNEIDITWTPDGRDVLYVRDVPQFDIFRRAADASTPEALVVTTKFDKAPTAVTRDGMLLYESDGDVFRIKMDTALRGTPERLLGGPGNQERAVISPNEKWMAYASSESGNSEVYLTTYPDPATGSRKQVSVNGGDRASWAPNGRTLYYSHRGRIHKVSVDPASGAIGKPQPLPRVNAPISWAPARDGRFLVGKIAGPGPRQAVKVVLNWSASLDSLK